MFLNFFPDIKKLLKKKSKLPKNSENPSQKKYWNVFEVTNLNETKMFMVSILGMCDARPVFCFHFVFPAKRPRKWGLLRQPEIV
jgi:hypothetical protein